MTESDFGGGGGGNVNGGTVVVLADATKLEAEVEPEAASSSSSSGLGTTTVLGANTSCNGLAPPRISVSHQQLISGATNVHQMPLLK